jgi:E3 ubiquitin-protein ligase NEDD4
LYCTKSVELYINRIKEGIEKVIPSRFLMVFEPHELEMIISGPQMINVKDWKNNTEYKGYSANDQVIIWFWEVVQ